MKKTLTRRLRSLLSLLLSVLLTCAPLSLSGCQELLEVPEENSELNLVLPSGQGLSDAVNKFHYLYPEVKINTTWQNSLNISTEELTQYKMELMAGKGPDVIFEYILNADDSLSQYKLMKAGAYADMGEFIQNDPDFHMEDYLEPVMQTGGFQGKQLLMPITYVPSLYITMQEILDDTGFDFESASKDWFGLMRETVAYSENPESKIPVFCSNWMEFDLRNAANIPFLDYNSDCLNLNYQSQVKEALNLYNAYLPFAPPHNAENGLMDALTQRKAVFANATASHLFGNLQYLTAQGEQLRFLPLKNVEGQRVAVAYNRVGINNASHNKQNAWNFIKILFSPYYQKQYGQWEGALTLLPVHKETCRQNLTMMDKYMGVSDELDGLLMEVKTLLTAPEAAYAHSLTGYTEIFPYMEDYFSGRAGLDETFDAALKKMERYLSE